MVDRVCPFCGGGFVVDNTRDSRRRRFCTRSCAAKHVNAIRAPRPLAERFWAMVVRSAPGECWSWSGATHEAGYGVLGRGGRSHGLARAHRVSWEIHHGPVPEGLWVLHKCDNPICTNPEHLFLGTAADNHADMRAKGRMVPPPRLLGDRNPRRIRPPKGELNGAAKLTDESVREIRRLYMPRVVTLADLATRFGVSESVVGAVVRGVRWSHVT
jgi:hypothetical protein